MRKLGRPIGSWWKARKSPRTQSNLEISGQTYHRWRKQYGGLKADDAKHLKELSKENKRLKRIVADAAMGVANLGAWGLIIDRVTRAECT